MPFNLFRHDFWSPWNLQMRFDTLGNIELHTEPARRDMRPGAAGAASDPSEGSERPPMDRRGRAEDGATERRGDAGREAAPWRGGAVGAPGPLGGPMALSG